RYTVDGVLDTSFGTGGQVITDLGTISEEGSDIFVQSDGKILVTGRSNNNFAIIRYNTDGKLDSGFGVGGQLTTDFGGIDEGRSIALQQDNRIVVAGFSNGNFALARYDSGLNEPPMGTIQVTQATDDGLGTTAGTLSWAIQQANQTAGQDTISLQSNVRLNFGDSILRMKPMIDSDITFEGNGYSISGDNNNNGQVDETDRALFFVKSGNVVFKNMTLKNGVANSNRGGAGMGGAMFIYDGNVALRSVTFDSNQAGGTLSSLGFGGGLGVNNTFGFGFAGSQGSVGTNGTMRQEAPTPGGTGGTGGFGGAGGAGGTGGNGVRGLRGLNLETNPTPGGTGATGGFG
ncbi:MAG TPA: hypothetical protein V6C65_18590, partial [Allocoleopsis sp.]